MSSSQSAPRCFCPECWAQVSPKATRCWLCHRPVRQAVVVQPPTPPPPPPRAAVTPCERCAQFQFGLASLMLVMTLTAVVLGVGVMAPGLGIALAVLAAPALVRTSIVAARSRARGQPLSPMRKITLFAASLVFAAVIALAAGAAFFATCLAAVLTGPKTPHSPLGKWFGAGIVCGSIMALLTAGLLVWLFWLRKRRRPPLQIP